ncbi:MAG: sel1 repeat family protein [Proteobacteria bacterium]|nr:sel1 repeat family protein [Pseudomonadota bacterium]
MKLFGKMAIISFLLFTIDANAYTYEKIKINSNKNLFEQYVTAYQSGVAICPNTDDKKIKIILQEEFSDYLQQAKKGSDKAAYFAGFGYLNGIGVHQDYSKGLSLLKKAADDNYVPAKLLYITMLFFKRNIVKNYLADLPSSEKELIWLQKEAKIGNLNSKFILAIIYLEMDQISKASYLIKPLAKQGYAEFQYLMGNIYYGLGDNIDYPKASYWYQKALNHDPPLIVSGSIAANLLEIYSKPESGNSKLAEYWQRQLEEITKATHCMN